MHIKKDDNYGFKRVCIEVNTQHEMRDILNQAYILGYRERPDNSNIIRIIEELIDQGLPGYLYIGNKHENGHHAGLSYMPEPYAIEPVKYSPYKKLKEEFSSVYYEEVGNTDSTGRTISII